MKIRKNLNAVAVVSLSVLLFITCTVASGFARSDKPITLDFVSFVPLANKVEYQFLKDEFIDKVNERAKGELVINVRGGPEVIAPFDLGVAVQKGTIDMAIIPTAFFESLVPGADSTKLSIYTAWEERENGIYEYIRDMYKKGGLYYLGRGEATTPGYFFLFVDKKIEKPGDFAGLKFGGSTAFHGFYKNIGASVATLAIPEYHSAMERHVVDGVVTSIYVGLQFGLHEVTKYIVSHGFYRSTVALPVNLNTWNQLPQHLQNLLIECIADYEKKCTSNEAEERSQSLKRAEAAGVKLLTFSPDTAKWFIEAANEGSWKYAQERFPDGNIPKLRDRITK